MAANGTGEEPQSPKDARLESLNRRLDRIKSEEERQAEGRVSAESQRVIKSAGMRILSDLIGLPFGAGLLGWLLDRLLGTWPMLFITLMVLGTAGGFWSIIKMSMQKK